MENIGPHIQGYLMYVEGTLLLRAILSTPIGTSYANIVLVELIRCETVPDHTLYQ